MPVEQALAAIEECGAPMVSIAGGEPLIHPEIDEIARRARRAQEVRLPVHERAADGDASSTCSSRRRTSPGPCTSTACASATTSRSCREGVFDKAVDRDHARPRRAGFRVTTNTTFFTHDSPKTVRDVLDFLNDELEVDAMMISPAYAYEKAPDQEHFLGVEQTREAVPRGVRRRPPQALAAEPHAAVPRLPRGQGRLRVHAVGHPELLGVRLAAARAT